MALEITNDNFETILKNEKVLVDFWAAWCGPCKMIGPIIDELATELEGKVVVGKVDVDNNHISIESPIGQGLRGKEVGDIAEIQVPAGTIKFKIIKIE